MGFTVCRSLTRAEGATEAGKRQDLGSQEGSA